jgi:hypothetical protein
MTSHGKTRPLFALAAVAALAAGLTACNSGGSSSPQYGYDPGGNPGYSNAGTSNVGTSDVGTDNNESNALNWENQSQENGNSAISDMGPGGAADPNDDGNSVSYSGDGGDDSGD